ncbi:MAG: hypothetical protein M1828_003113 [Chrysothrix sp. TS-e1954]|nr:MAG: hypothetical protein M1828_003113 [Chrysothrix sp. TS-e1954]
MRASNKLPEPPEPLPPSEIARIRDTIDDRFKQISELWSAIRRPLPTQTQDGTYVKADDPDTYLHDLSRLRPGDMEAITAVAEKAAENAPWNDRRYLMEHIIQTAAHLPYRQTLSTRLTNGFIAKLYNDLQHPPLSYLGQHLYRSADGSGNSLLHPELGAAHTPYARTVKPVNAQRGALPDPGVIFDSVLARTVNEEHQNKISSVLFYVATIIIHDVFRTSHTDPEISDTSSYLDLAPLYGSDQQEQNQMRTFSDGKIKPDCFSEKRILGFPPGVGMLLIMFNRFHNHVVTNLASINEHGRFDKPRDHDTRRGSAKTWKKYDEDLFQTGRLVTCGLYVNIILIDYVRTILNLNRTDEKWQLDPRVDIANGPPVGQGNHVSCEFNLVYRWHSTLSDKDTKWTEDRFAAMFPNRTPADIPRQELLRTLGQVEEGLDQDPAKRPFAGLQRGDDGKFGDDGLVEILTGDIEDCANSFGANRVPTVLRAVEILGIEQARTWNVASLNEFREHFGLTKYNTFEEINDDPYVSEQLRHLYQDPHEVELYPGLLCEQSKKAVLPGSGLQPGYTISRAILSDAVALVRGDRFYTTDFHAKALTSWGYAEVNHDTKIDNGCVFYKLIYNAFPNHFEENSVFAHYPLTIPSEMQNVLTLLGKDHIYSFGRPQRKPCQRTVSSYAAATQVMDDKQTYGVTWGPAMEFLMGPAAKNFMLAGDGKPNTQSRKMMGEALYVEEWYKDVKTFYLNKTRELLDRKAYTLAGFKQVDLIRDIGNLVHVHFCAEMFCLPLKSDSHPHGIFTENELYMILAAVFTCVFFDVDPMQSFPVHQLSYEATQKLGNIVQNEVEALDKTSVFTSVYQYFVDRHEESPLRRYGAHMIERLLASGVPPKELVWGHILGTAGGMVPNQGQLFGQMLDYYFSEGWDHWKDIARWAAEDTKEADEMLMRYMLEGSRIFCGSGVMRKVQRDVKIVDGDKTVHLHEGDQITVDLNAASRDPARFEDPETVRLDRDLDSYLQFGWGPHQCLGKEMTQIALTAMLRVVAQLPNLRPAPGPQGRVKRVPADPTTQKDDGRGYQKYLTEAWDTYFPFPCSLKANWDNVDIDGDVDMRISKAVEVPAPSATNGHVNGDEHGKTNGHVNGHVNGHTGAGHKRGRKRKSRA